VRGLVLTTVLTVAVAGGAAAAGGLDAIVGKAVFERIWVGAGASTGSADGLGPLHNARSCAGCHLGGGAARISQNEHGALAGAGLVVRLADADGHADPVYGDQIQTRGLPGQAAEAEVVFALAEAVLDGEPGPRVAPRLEALAFGPLRASAGVRRAPSLVGRAAFDAVDAAAILALADPDDADGDGISGRVHWVGDGAGGRAIGRYGWRATGATLHRQVAAAFAVDLGLSTETFPDPAGDCTSAQKDCRNARHGDTGGAPEVDARLMAAITVFLTSLRPLQVSDPAGETLFASTGCAACHVPALPVAGHPPAATAGGTVPVTGAGGTVPAFTDLLLHDMGAGLADPATVAGVAPSEWRTAPLFGLVGGHPASRRYLHDGRAATLDEAIRWHGGEAAAAHRAYAALSDSDREKLLKYLEKL
jgi:CxxC motif-containing protein (DUF1111 family)